MQKNLTVLFAFAIFVLVVGWAITPAQAHGDFENCLHPKNPDHKHCQQANGGNGDGGGGNFAPVKLSMGNPPNNKNTMVTADLSLDLIQNTSKWLRIGSTGFDGLIVLNFDTSDCFQAAGDFGSNPTGPTGLQTLFEKELRDAIITKGFLDIGIDRKNVGEGTLTIRYLGNLGKNDGTGDATRIKFPKQFENTYEAMELLAGENELAFEFNGTVYLEQLTAGGTMTNPFLGCNNPMGVETDQTVTFTVDLDPQ